MPILYNNKKTRHRNVSHFLVLMAILLLNTTLVAKESILVVGGTGRVGSEIVKALSMVNNEITVFSRTTNNYSRLNNLDINFLLGDVMKSEDIEKVFSRNKYDVVINALAKVGDSPNPHAIGQENLLNSSEENGVKHFILIGSVGAGEEQSELVSDIVWSMWKDILQEKGRAEEKLINSAIPFTIIRTGIILYEDEAATGNAELIKDQSIVGIITRKDLAQLTVECILKSQCFNNIYHAYDSSLGTAIE